MSQESSTPPFHGRGIASSSPPFSQSKENVHEREVLRDDKEEQPEKFKELSEEQEASKEQEESDTAANNGDDDNVDKDIEADIGDSVYEPSPDDSLKPKTMTTYSVSLVKVSYFDEPVDVDDSVRKKTKLKEKVLGDDDGGNPSSDPEKQIFQRQSSAKEKKFRVINDILDYPFVNTNSLRDFIESSRNADVSVSQLMGRTEELRNKYEKIVREKGKNQRFSEPCDQNEFKLSKKIWGAGTETKHADGQKKFDSKEKKSPKVGQEVDLSMYPFLEESLQCATNTKGLMPVSWERIAKEFVTLIGSSKAAELDEKWRKLLMDEIEVYKKGSELIEEQMQLLMDAVESLESQY